MPILGGARIFEGAPAGNHGADNALPRHELPAIIQ
jgi:hypothetical protein